MELTTTTEVIDLLGPKAVAELTHREMMAVYKWKAFKTFPPDTYLVLRTAIEQHGYKAPDSLWRMLQPEGSS